MDERLTQRALDGVADRLPVDWDALEQEAGSAVDRDWLHWLRVLDRIAGVHMGGASGSLPADIVSTITPKPAAGDEQPTRWGKFMLLQQVGEGGFGRVYRAWDPDLELEVAIKILHRRVADASQRDALLSEGRALAKIRHENVVRVLGVESHDDQIALRMEFVHGETLDKVLERLGTLNPREASIVGEDVARALAAVHRAGFVHRDVKAVNVMREHAGRIVLMDLGAGQLADDLKVPGKVPNVGTPRYMAPEVIFGAPATAGSDVYSVGVLLYHLVTGHYPVPGDNMTEIRLGHIQGRRHPLVELRPDAPAHFIQVVERALSADLHKRYASAGALLEALSQERESQGSAVQGAGAGTVLRAAGWTLGTLAVMTGLGALSSREFNYALGRSGFVDESLMDAFRVGLMSSLAPAMQVLEYSVKFALLLVCRRLCVTWSSRAAALDVELWRRVRSAALACHLDDPLTAGSMALLLSASLFAYACYAFVPLLGALTSDLSSADTSVLALLAPSNAEYHNQFRETFFWSAAWSGILFCLVARLTTGKRDLYGYGILWGIAAVFMLSLTFMQFPWRVMKGNKMDAATWQGASCYVLGQRADDVLLFCPAAAPPRRWIVKSHDAGLKVTGHQESVFTPLSARPPATASP